MVLKFQMIKHQVKRMVKRKWNKSKPCPFCGKVHPIQNVLFKFNSSGFLVRFKIVPKENKDEETGEEKEEKKEEEVE